MNMFPVMLVMPVSTTHHQGCEPDNEPNRGEITLACKPVPWTTRHKLQFINHWSQLQTIFQGDISVGFFSHEPNPPHRFWSRSLPLHGTRRWKSGMPFEGFTSQILFFLCEKRWIPKGIPKGMGIFTYISPRSWPFFNSISWPPKIFCGHFKAETMNKKWWFQLTGMSCRYLGSMDEITPLYL